MKKNEEIKNEETMETAKANEAAQDNEIQEEKKPGLLTKAANFAKDNGPKAIKVGKKLIVAGIIGVGCYALGVKRGSKSEELTGDEYFYGEVKREDSSSDNELE